MTNMAIGSRFVHRTVSHRSRRSSLQPRRSILLTALLTLGLIYAITPLIWLILAATKSTTLLFSQPAFSFGTIDDFVNNLIQVFTYDNYSFLRWAANSLFYVLAGAGTSSLIATLGGYALAKYRFRGRMAVIGVVIAASAVPGGVLVIPTFLLFSHLGLVNTIWAVILPYMVSPFGLFLMWVYAGDAVPDEIVEAARLDGANEGQIFTHVSLRLLISGFITVFIFSFVGVWNDFFMPSIMLTDSKLYPLALGLAQWNALATLPTGNSPIYNLVVMGSLLTIIPIVAVFLFLQRYWQSGIGIGSARL